MVWISPRKRWGPREEHGRLAEDGRLHTLHEWDSDSLYYATRKNWFVLRGPPGDEEETQLALLFSVLDMYEATGEDKFETCPLVVEASLAVAYPGMVWLEGAAESHGPERPETATAEADLEMSYAYGGGIPITHILLHEVTGGGSDLSRFERSRKVCWDVDRPQYGTVAAQYGKGHEFRSPRFSDNRTALEFSRELLKRAPAVFMMVGFYLDRPINMAGDSGWSIVEQQAG